MTTDRQSERAAIRSLTLALIALSAGVAAAIVVLLLLTHTIR